MSFHWASWEETSIRISEALAHAHQSLRERFALLIATASSMRSFSLRLSSRLIESFKSSQRVAFGTFFRAPRGRKRATRW